MCVVLLGSAVCACVSSKTYKAVVRGQQHLIAKVTHVTPLHVSQKGDVDLRDRSCQLAMMTTALLALLRAVPDKPAQLTAVTFRWAVVCQLERALPP